MWDVKLAKQTSKGRPLWFYLYYVGCKVRKIFSFLKTPYTFYLYYVGCKVASFNESLQRFNCFIFTMWDVKKEANKDEK